MRHLGGTILLGLLVGSSVRAEPTKVLVKSGEIALPAILPSPGDRLFGVTCAAARLTTRNAQPAPAPFPPEPPPTAQPVAAACFKKPNDFLETEGYQVRVRFDSLKDLGDWRIDCKAKFISKVDFASQTCMDGFGCIPNCFHQEHCTNIPQFCEPGGAHCGWDCFTNKVVPFDSPMSFDVQVFNNQPSGSFSVSPATVTCGETVTFTANASDVDGAVQFLWEAQGPGGQHPGLPNQSQVSLQVGAADLGAWSVKVHLIDSQGEDVVLPAQPFSVVGGKPSIAIQGPAAVKVLQPINLDGVAADACSTDLKVQWTAQGPGGQAPSFAPGPHLHMDTGEKQIGKWTFTATATNAQGEVSAPATHAVTVENLPPQVQVEGKTQIEVGEPIELSAAKSTDPDGPEGGGGLTFRWDLVQAPEPAGIKPKEGHATGAALRIPAGQGPTTLLHAGTWIFRLTVTDNEQEAAAPKEVQVLVDAAPEAKATSEVAGSQLTLSAAESIDPDTDVEHVRLDGAPPVLSAGIVEHTWSLSDAPLEWQGAFATGALDEVFGSQVSAHDPKAVIDLSLLKPGSWEFALRIKDAEGGTAATLHRVELRDDTPPTAVTQGPQRYLVLDGALHRDIVLDGSGSFDADNGPGDTGGIKSWEWSVAWAPPGCNAPEPQNEKTTTLFAAGAAVPPECHGFWAVELLVTDDDDPARTGTATAAFFIGNCPGQVCIDSPRSPPRHKEIEFTDKVDVEIACHLDSGIYGPGPFASGLIMKLSIFHEDDPTSPVHYEDLDFNALPTGEGGLPVFHWNGRTAGGGRPKPGAYTIQLVLEDSALTLATSADVQPGAIVIATADPAILASSDTIESFDLLQSHAAQLTFDYTVTGAAKVDLLQLRIYDAGGAHVFGRDEPAPGSGGTLSWDGVLADGAVIAPGAYEAEIVAIRQGATLGTSPRHKFVVVRSDLDVDTDRDGKVDDAADETDEGGWTKTRGAIYSVNIDRDGQRSTPAGVPVADAVDFDADGQPVAEDFVIDNEADTADIAPLVIRALGAPLPAGVTVVLKAAEQEDAESIHLFGGIAAGEKAIWGGIGARTGGTPQPLEVDLTKLVDPGKDVTLGLEGLLFRYADTTDKRLVFDGEVDLTMEVRRAGKALFGDSVRLKVAPWLMLAHTTPSTAVWVADFGTRNEGFRITPAGSSGYVGLDDSKQLQTVLSTTQWQQDHVETGYYERPGGPKTLATFRLPYGGDQPSWPQQKLLAGNAATFQLGSKGFYDGDGTPQNFSGSFGGNLELLPPTPEHPLGSIVVGDTRSQALFAFLGSQEMQPVVELPVRWLRVGHVDEIITFTSSPGIVIVADPVDAWTLLESIPVAERERSVFFATGAAPLAGQVTKAAVEQSRIETGIDTTGEKWQYVRIIKDTGSKAAGQVAHIAKRGNGFLVVDQVWETGSKVLPGGAAETSMFNTMDPYVLKPDPSPQWIHAPASGDRFVLVEGSRSWVQKVEEGEPEKPGVPAIVTVAEVLADAGFEKLNTVEAKAQIDAARKVLQTAAGGTLQFVPVPVLFVGPLADFAFARMGSAFTPGLSNAQEVAGTLYFSRQFGPRDAAGDDLFEKVTKQRVPEAKFVDDWDLYHARLGGVHCGSTVVRQPFSFPWWAVP